MLATSDAGMRSHAIERPNPRRKTDYLPDAMVYSKTRLSVRYHERTPLVQSLLTIRHRSMSEGHATLGDSVGTLNLPTRHFRS